MNQYATRWLKERQPEILVRPLQVNAVVARRATMEEWRSRDKKATHIPIGSVVVEVNRGLSPEKLAQLDLQTLVDSGAATAFLVEGHAEINGPPLCRLIGGDSIIVDYPLLPIPLAEIITEPPVPQPAIIPIVYGTNW